MLRFVRAVTDSTPLMLCPVCHQRKAKRACPALGKQICAVCCGTKRLVEIACPADCGYLASARTHPPAVIQRQQEMDRAMLLPLLQGLSERQARLFLMLAAVTSRHQADMLQKLVDEDIAQAAGALASTLETAAKGIVYEHQPASLVAARLMTELKGRRRRGGKKCRIGARARCSHCAAAHRARREDDGDGAGPSTQRVSAAAGAGPGAAAGRRNRPPRHPTAPASSIIIP